MRNPHIDILKTIAITAVVIGHIFPATHSFLRAHDIFFVVAGYFSMMSIAKYDKGNWFGSYFQFVTKRLWRLLPIIAIAGMICLAWGYLVMLPDDYENLAQSVIASNCFTNNILLSITTYDYWNIANDYKPLMHTWYLGVLMQFYLTIPLILVTIGNCFGRYRRTAIITSIIVLIISSLLLYQAYDDESYHKYYYLQYRLFEFGIGALAYYIASIAKLPANSAWCRYATATLYALILSAMMLRYDSIPVMIKLLAMDICVALFLVISPTFEIKSPILRAIQKIGGASLSIFMWHQIVIGFARYSFTSDLTAAVPLCSILIVISVLAYVTYKYVEPLKPGKLAWAFVIVTLLITSSLSLHIYNIGGIVRDVPELEAYKGHGEGRIWALYNWNCFGFDHDFEENGKPKWLIIGNSIGRDFVNVVRESEIADSVNISYSQDQINGTLKHRMNDADIIFYCARIIDVQFLNGLKTICPTNRPFFIVGTKYFGENNGQIYFHRHDNDYLQSTIELPLYYDELNQKYKAEYGDAYIDFLDIARTVDGRIRVFTDDGKFISQDCKHFTRAGAIFYAQHIDWNRFL